jgi:HEAT repeat protein
MKRFHLYFALLLALALGSGLLAQAQDLQSTDAKVRQKAVKQLVDSGGAGTQKCEALAGLVRDPAPDVRDEVVIALIKVGGQQCLEPLRGATRDSSPDIQSMAVDGIVNFYMPGYVKFGWLNSVKSFGGNVKKRFTTTEPLILQPSIQAAPADIAAISPLITGGSSMDSRANAARAAGILRGSAALPQLKEALHSENDTVVIEALRSLEKIGDMSVGPEVVPSLASPNADVRAAAAHAAGQLRAKEAVRDLSRLAKGDKDKEVRRESLVALAKIPENGEERTFLLFLRDKDEQMRAAAAEGLGRGGAASDLSTVNDAFAVEKSESARLSMAFAAVQLGDLEKVRYLVDGLDSTFHRGEARAFLIELARTPRILAELYTPLTSGTRNQKIELATVVSRSGDRDSVAHLQRLTNDSDPRVAEAAIRELKNLQARL